MIISGNLEVYKVLDKDTFQHLRKETFQPPFNRYGLDLMREKASRELILEQYYAGRAPYELLQNADDAGANEARFILLSDGLVFVHDGKWFNVGNFQSLADGWSDKDPNQCIGHKGLGFRSVLEVTPSPYIVRISQGPFFGVRFSRKLNEDHIRETLKQAPHLSQEVERWTRGGRSICPVMYIPASVELRQLGSAELVYETLHRGAGSTHFTTMFWLPVDDPSGIKAKDNPATNPIRGDEAGRARMVDFVKNEVSVLLPFLKSIRCVSVFDDARLLAETTVEESASESGISETVVTTRLPVGSQSRHYLLLRDEARIPLDVKNAKDRPEALRHLEKSRLVLALPLHDGRPDLTRDSVFHVYFPTQEPTGFGFIVHADFQVLPDRTRLTPGSYNRWLFKQVATLVAGRFLSELLARFDPVDALVAVAPVAGEGTSAATKSLLEAVIGALRVRVEPFVPSRAGLLPPPLLSCRLMRTETASGMIISQGYLASFGRTSGHFFFPRQIDRRFAGCCAKSVWSNCPTRHCLT